MPWIFHRLQNPHRTKVERGDDRVGGRINKVGRRIYQVLVSSAQNSPSLFSRTSVMVRHASDILAHMVHSVFANDLQLVILWYRAALRHMYPHDVQAAIFSRASKTVHTFDDTHTLDARVVLPVGVSRLASNVTFQACSVPDLNRFVVGA